MSMKNNSLFSRILISSSVALLVVTVVLLILSVSVARIPQYEKLYPTIVLVAEILFAFLSTRLVVKQYDHHLLLIALIQGAFIVLAYFLITFVFNGFKMELNSFFYSSIVMLFSCFFAVFLPQKRKKYAKRL